MTYIYDLAKKEFIEVEIIQVFEKLPTKKDGWKFDWNKILKQKNTKTYALRLKNKTNHIEGIIQLRIESDMLIMDLVEIAPHNIGSLNKKFDSVAGCLIAFGCRESFKIEGTYKGFLTFIAKTDLIDWYKQKYGAIQVYGQRMYIDDIMGRKLIREFL